MVNHLDCKPIFLREYIFQLNPFQLLTYYIIYAYGTSKNMFVRSIHDYMLNMQACRSRRYTVAKTVENLTGVNVIFCRIRLLHILQWMPDWKELEQKM